MGVVLVEEIAVVLIGIVILLKGVTRRNSCSINGSTSGRNSGSR